MAWIGFIWLRTGAGVGHLWRVQENACSIKSGNASTEWNSMASEGLCSMRVFIYLFVCLDSVYKQQQSEHAKNIKWCLHLTTCFNSTVRAWEQLKLASLNWESSVCCKYTGEDSAEMNVLVDFTWCYKDAKRVAPDIGYHCNLVLNGSEFDLFHRHQYSRKYEGDSKSKGKIHLTAVIQVTVSNFTYYFST